MLKRSEMMKIMMMRRVLRVLTGDLALQVASTMNIPCDDKELGTSCAIAKKRRSERDKMEVSNHFQNA